MKKISALAALTLAGLVLASPAHADNDGDRGRVIIAGRDVTSANLCRQVVALVPVAAPGIATELDAACYDREHTDDTRGQAPEASHP